MNAKDIANARYRALCESDTDLAANICKRVAELPDRSSPDDWPEAMLVTHEELTFIVVDELLTEIDRLVNGKPPASTATLTGNGTASSVATRAQQGDHHEQRRTTARTNRARDA